MGLQTVSILTEGVWASLTGGWFYDKKQSDFSNLFHLYIWLTFLCFPFINYLFFNTWISWLLYCLFVALIFTVVKSINEYFHRIFDTGKCIKDETVSDADPASSSLMCNEGDSGEKETLEMVPLSHNSHNDEDDLQQRISLNEENAENNVAIAIESNNNNNNNNNDDNCSNEITSKTIDLKADVHCNHDTDSSIGNLSLLFKSEDDEDRKSFENQNSKDNTTKLVSGSETSLSNMTAVYAKGNSSNNSVGVLENSNSTEQMPTFRRARSEIETIKSSDKSTKTPLVPPSHPVSLEVIHSKDVHKNKSVALGKNRFDKDEIEMLEMKTQKSTKTSSSQLDEGENFNNKMGRIEENSEKPIAGCSSAYFKKDCDSSEDGDESEISLCTNGSIKINKKLSKQPMRKARFSSNRKRSKSSAGRSAAVPEWVGGTHKTIYHELKERFRSKPSNIVNTSDEEYVNEGVKIHVSGKKHSGKHFSMPYRLQYQSDTSSSLPSSSSSSSMASDDRMKEKTDMEQYSMNFPSTSSGITSKPVDGRKRIRGKYGAKEPKYLWNSSLEEDSLIRYEKQLKLRQLWNDHQTLSAYASKSHNSENPESMDLRGSRSNSIRDGGESSKNSVVCLPSSSNIIGEMLSLPGSHLATSHEDTTVGAVHVFQDERGNWFTYTFGENSTGMAKGLCLQNPFSKMPSTSNNNGDANSEAGAKFKFNTNNALIPSNSIYYLNNRLLSMDSGSVVPSINTNNNNNNNNNNGANSEPSRDGLVIINGHSSQTPDSVDTNLRSIYFDRFPMFNPDSDVCCGFVLNDQSFSHSFQRSQQQLKASKYYYEMKICDLFSYKIRFDRLELSAFLDRSLTTCEMICSIMLAILVAVFASILLHKEFFKDIRLFVFCFVVAGSQYTLLKSVQPDAASPTHGFNRVAIYSRPIYFCLVSAILLLSNEYYHSGQTWMDDSMLKIYGFNLINRDLFLAISNVSQTLILIFPLLFMFGLLPQFNTFVMYIFEHIDIHMFGGTASTMGMVSATYSIVRSILAVGFLYLCAHLFNIKEQQRTPSFSVFCGILVAVSYLLSRSTSDPSLLWNVIYEFLKTIKNFTISLITNSKSKSGSTPASASTTIPISNSQSDSLKSSRSKTNESHEALIDPLPEKLKNIALSRFESDMITCIFVTISVFSVHVSSIFKLQPFFNDYITIMAIIWSFLLHYLLPQFRKQLPWLVFSSPICKSHEYKKFEVFRPAKNMWFEKVQAWLWLIEKNIIYPLLFLGYITTDCPLLIKNYGHNLGLFFLVLFGFKSLRSSFNDPSHNYIILIFTHLFFTYDFRAFIQDHDNIFLMNYFIMSFVYYKVTDFLLKFRFVITYVAPWQITWGSAFHAFAQPFSVPHSALLLVQIFVSSLLSAPLQPILGSAIFFTSYVRPIKFWERDYNTKRVDHSNTRLASQIDKAQIGSDDNNLNSIFYEHLTRSLQHSLYGDLALGRWGDVSQGDCFVLASDNLNCLIHIIELGNGFVTFQVRGLEFRGTYCQQREVEAITENVSDDDGCCCCEAPGFNGVLSINAAFNQRWLSWEVTHTNYVLEGYSISEHIASTIVQPYDLRKALITYYVKSIIYFCITNENFIKWIKNEEIRDSLDYLNEKNFVDLDPTFNYNIDDDYDILASGVTRSAFKSCYRQWIKYCIEQGVTPSNLNEVKKNEESVITLCFGLSLLARRALGTASHHNSALMNVEFFLYGFHALFKGDFRIHCPRDEWVFQDMDFLNKVVSPSVRMSLKLHQDQFINYEEYENPKTLFESISQYQKSMVISHEADPVWRKAILSNVPSLLALRHVFDEGTDHYKVIMLNKRFLNFRIIKINRECVRGLWAGQQQELIFLRNRNPERGSIQNAKQVLRNIINSSCDQPIGYPIYVSPLTTSFSETSAPLNQIIGPSLSFSIFKRAIVGFYNKIRNRCNEVCSSNSRQQTELNFTAARLTKSESNDRGLDDPNSAKGSLIVSTHPQIVQFSNYSQYLKKRVLKTNEEEALHSNSSNLVNRNVISLLQNSLNHQPESPSSNVGNLASGSSKTTPVVQSDISVVTMEQHSKSIIVEKGLSLPKGDAV